MKTMIIAMMAIAIGQAHASSSTSNESDQMCTKEAKSALAKKQKINTSAVTFFNGAIVGDGVDAIEIDVFQVKGKPGLYKVELDTDACDLWSIETVNN